MCDSHFLSYYPLHEQTLKLTIALYRVTDYFPKSEILRNDLRGKANEIFQQMTEYDADIEHDKTIESLIRKIRTIKGYMEIASTLNYVRSVNFTILKKEYGLIEQFLEVERAKHIKQSIHEGIKDAERNPSAYALAEKDDRDLEKKKEVQQHTRVTAHETEIKRERKIASETEPLGMGFHERTDRALNERQRVIMDRLARSGRGKISDLYTSLKGVSSKTIQRDLQNLVDKEMLKKEGEKRWTVYSVVRG